MLKDYEIVLIRQFCIERAITILATVNEATTLAQHLEVADKIEDFLMREVDTKKPQLGRD